MAKYEPPDIRDVEIVRDGRGYTTSIRLDGVPIPLDMVIKATVDFTPVPWDTVTLVLAAQVKLVDA